MGESLSDQRPARADLIAWVTAGVAIAEQGSGGVPCLQPQICKIPLIRSFLMLSTTTVTLILMKNFRGPI